MSDLLVLGLGNSLMADDGVGVHAVRALQSQVPAGILAVEVGTAILRAEHLLASYRRILVFDALRAGGRPGSVYVTTLDQIAVDVPGDSLHNLNLTALARIAGRDPGEIVVVAAEPGRIEIGTELSVEVAAALDHMVGAAVSVHEHWRDGVAAAAAIGGALGDQKEGSVYVSGDTG